MTARAVGTADVRPRASRRAGWRRSYFWRTTRRVFSNPSGAVGATGLLLIVLVGVIGPLVVTKDPYAQDILNRLSPPAWASGGSWIYPLGTDHLGRDELSRLVNGATITLRVSFLASCIAATVGLVFGLTAGYAGGAIGAVILRLADAMVAFPFMVMAVTVVAMFGNSERNLILTLGLVAWVGFTRTARAETLSAKEREYVLAARSIGASPWRIVRSHILPNVLPSAIVIFTFTMGSLVLAESSLSFLGFGLEAGTPSWGKMVAEGRDHLQTTPRLALIPGVALTLLIVSVGLFGDALRDALDPRLER